MLVNVNKYKAKQHLFTKTKFTIKKVSIHDQKYTF